MKELQTRTHENSHIRVCQHIKIHETICMSTHQNNIYVKHNDIERNFHATYRVAATVKSRKAEGVGTNQSVKEGQC